jgi:exopolyphosphatase/guanosine-5'-triphosphate,3'-diphosphate pyrophosphatase
MLTDPLAIIDIGSNSVRLVVYAGSTRVPSPIFNEKVMAGLGRGVGAGGMLSEEAQQRALAALGRFRILTRQMRVGRTRVVATAAVRDAANGAAFIERVRETGFEPELLSGEQEAVMAGQGVLSGIPDADGIVGDLGGGSLELVDISEGQVRRTVSLPLGVLRLNGLGAKPDAIAKKLAKALDGLDFRKRTRKRNFYLVGGSWRSLARLDMQLTGYPLPITHQYGMAPGRAAELHKAVTTLKPELKSLPMLQDARIPTLPPAAALLRALVDELKPGRLVVSSFGIREGLLFDDLGPDARARDPLIEGARDAARSLGRFDEHGSLLDRWIAPVFDDGPAAARLRKAACLLADIAWAAHPDFRAERAVDMALHGNWVGVDGPGRVVLAQALAANYGQGRGFAEHPTAKLCRPDVLARAAQWGLAMRLGQRLSGGVAASLERSRLAVRDGRLRLELHRRDQPLYGEAVERRLHTLANALGLTAEAVAVEPPLPSGESVGVRGSERQRAAWLRE